MFERLWKLLGRERAPRPDLACPVCGADNPEYATRCKACGKTVDNYYRREKAAFTRDYDDAMNSGVFIMWKDDSCPACKGLQSITYLPWEIPRLPVEGCTHPKGCRCSYMPVTRLSLGFPGMGLRARRKDWEERQRQAKARRERGGNVGPK